MLDVHLGELASMGFTWCYVLVVSVLMMALLTEVMVFNV